MEEKTIPRLRNSEEETNGQGIILEKDKLTSPAINVLSAVGIKIEVIITPHVSCNHHYSGSTLCSCCLAVLDDYQATSQAAKQLTSTRLDCTSNKTALQLSNT
ncbi:hypothetical protein GQX74_012011 [Glossina fuscipes]|nr:hypothetical protein GQX74_012011 [Glossina fuscipes]